MEECEVSSWHRWGASGLEIGKIESEREREANTDSKGDRDREKGKTETGEAERGEQIEWKKSQVKGDRESVWQRVCPWRTGAALGLGSGWSSGGIALGGQAQA